MKKRSPGLVANHVPRPAQSSRPAATRKRIGPLANRISGDPSSSGPSPTRKPLLRPRRRSATPPPAAAAASASSSSTATPARPEGAAPRRLMSCLRRARHLPFPLLCRGLSFSSVTAEAEALPPPRPSAGRRVVVTGLGAVTPLARGVGATWDRLVAGRCAVRSLAAEDLRLPEETAGRTLEQLPSRVVAAVPRGKGEEEFDEEAWTKV